MPEMTKQKWEDVAKGFQKYADLPNCIGAIDGKHIRLIQPTGTGSLYYNYKSLFSTVLLAVCDANIINFSVWILVHMGKVVIQQYLTIPSCTKNL